MVPARIQGQLIQLKKVAHGLAPGATVVVTQNNKNWDFEVSIPGDDDIVLRVTTYKLNSISWNMRFKDLLINGESVDPSDEELQDSVKDFVKFLCPAVSVQDSTARVASNTRGTRSNSVETRRATVIRN